MMKTRFALLIGLFIPMFLFSQSNITISNPVAEQILLGSYDPAEYAPAVVVMNADSLLHGLVSNVSKDTLLANLQHIDSFHNRNSGSDTISQVSGIGAVRRWIHSRFTEYSALNENRLVVSYMDFDRTICGQTHHRNVLAILPGLDTTQKEIMVVEGHYDTRCENVCDTSCYSPGMEDNGSGTVLVMELARLMSRYAFDHTIVFACVTAEDQGLYGAIALSAWLKLHNVKVRACLNNDVIGGVICGQTSSPPGCPYLNDIDSTHVRVFSYSAGNDSSAVSPHKQLARYVKMQQEQRINPLLETPMDLKLMIYEDRIGRSGDHVPFRQRGFTALRFCSANEHGDGSGTPPDRQHSTRDILGIDTTNPPDGLIDSFFVDMSYLRRNTITNGVNLGLLAMAPPSPGPVYQVTSEGMEITLQGADTLYSTHIVGMRTRGSGSLYFDTLYSFTGTSHILIPGILPGKETYFSVANTDENVESLFSDEFRIFPVGIQLNVAPGSLFRIEQNVPNPFTRESSVKVYAEETSGKSFALLVRDMTGRIVQSIPVDLSPGENTVTVRKTAGMKGLYTYSLQVDGAVVASRKMIVL